MTDRELLELAAKAAGMRGLEWDDRWSCGDVNGSHVVIGEYDANGPLLWNPLADDGDALRLATELEFNIYHVTPYVFVEDLQGARFDVINEMHGQDKFAATRRAIVRAAAEIGRAA